MAASWPTRILDVVKDKLIGSERSVIHSWDTVIHYLRHQSSVSGLAFKVLPFLLPCIWFFQTRRAGFRRSTTSHDGPADTSDSIGMEAIASDPGLLKKHSQYCRFHVPGTGYTYPSVRVFYRPHPQGNKFPCRPTALPLIVFIHGLGGSIAQFHPLLTSLVNLAPCLAMDLPGCGLSRFEPKEWSAYTTGALVQLLAVIIETYLDVVHQQGLVLISHSMGTSLAALLASKTSPYASLISQNVIGMIAICPVAEPPTEEQVKTFRKLLNIPGPLFDLWRAWDRKGGPQSVSVYRFTGKDADLETRKLQVRFNEQSRTPVWRRMAYGSLPDYSSGRAIGGIAGADVWAGISVPLYLVAGEADHVTPVENAVKIAKFLGREDALLEAQDREVITSIIPQTGMPSSALLADRKQEEGGMFEASTNHDRTGDLSHPILRSRDKVGVPFKVRILPAPASHALLYSAQTARPLSAHIQHFLASAIDPRLSLGWQLQYLTTEGKWDVKNLRKWKGVQNVSRPIGGIFRAIKTLREVDDEHAPKYFVRDWAPVPLKSSSDQETIEEGKDKNMGKGKDGLGAIAAVIDISHDSPVYDPQGLEIGGIAYRKFPTVSKLPPTVDEVKHFIDLTDELRAELVSSIIERDPSEPYPLIAVHCHYGFNRTGFFIVCYLVERKGWRLRDAIREFAAKRPPGIRHPHFLDELWSRYWTREGGVRED